jgi:hypothetical protein
MEQQNYTCQIEVPVSAQDAFDGISNVPAWWAQNFEGSSADPGDVFTVRFGETYGTFRIAEMIPASKVIWFCEDSYLDLLKDKTQWKGTSIVWEIIPSKVGSVIKMTHVGLAPGKECYNDCEQGWNFFIKESLFKFLVQSKGEPGSGIRATINNYDRVYRGILYPKSGGVLELAGKNIVIDVGTTNVEHVTAVHAVLMPDEGYFDPRELKGSHYMVVEDKPQYEGIDVYSDLAALVKVS